MQDENGFARRIDDFEAAMDAAPSASCSQSFASACAVTQQQPGTRASPRQQTAAGQSLSSPQMRSPLAARNHVPWHSPGTASKPPKETSTQAHARASAQHAQQQQQQQDSGLNPKEQEPSREAQCRAASSSENTRRVLF